MKGHDLELLIEDVLAYARLIGLTVWVGETYLFIKAELKLISLYCENDVFCIDRAGNGSNSLKFTSIEEYKEKILELIDLL